MNTEATSPIISEAPQAPAASKNAAGVVKRSSSYFIDPTKITRKEGWNPRFDFGEIGMLAASISANGMLNPIRVKRITGVEGKEFELIDGDRRLTACEKLIKGGFTFPEGIPAIIVDKNQEELTSLIQMFVANDGKAFLPLEEAAAYKRLIDGGLTLKEVAAQVGRKHMHVSQMLALIDADESLKEAVASGKVGKQLAKDIASTTKGDKEKQKELTTQAVELGKNTKDKKKRRALLKDIDDAKVKKASAKGKTLKIRALTDDQLSDLGAKMSKHLVVLMKEAGLTEDVDLRAWVAGDEARCVAYALGSLEALKAAAGEKIALEI